jgi:uncharacterized protein (DUF2132 family)
MPGAAPIRRLPKRLFRAIVPRMATPKSADPLHGVTLEQIVTCLQRDLGWAELGRLVPIRCFLFDPSVKSSLTFLRRTPWARAKVESLYVQSRPPL